MRWLILNVVIVLTVAGCSPKEKAEQATQQKRIEEMTARINEDQAEKNKALQLEYDKITNRGEVSAMRNFIQKHQGETSVLAETLTSKMEKSLEDTLFKDLARNPTDEDLVAFESEFPNALHRKGLDVIREELGWKKRLRTHLVAATDFAHQVLVQRSTALLSITAKADVIRKDNKLTEGTSSWPVIVINETPGQNWRYPDIENGSINVWIPCQSEAARKSKDFSPYDNIHNPEAKYIREFQSNLEFKPKPRTNNFPYFYFSDVRHAKAAGSLTEHHSLFLDCAVDVTATNESPLIFQTNVVPRQKILAGNLEGAYWNLSFHLEFEKTNFINNAVKMYFGATTNIWFGSERRCPDVTKPLKPATVVFYSDSEKLLGQYTIGGTPPSSRGFIQGAFSTTRTMTVVSLIDNRIIGREVFHGNPPQQTTGQGARSGIAEVEKKSSDWLLRLIQSPQGK